jgi:DNA-binding MarR family transcriptional regulator
MTTFLIEQIRAFNRFYTGILGLLDQHLLGSPYSLPEARILYEINHQSDCTAKSIMTAFDIDKGYLSRILLKFQKNKLITMAPSPTDGRSTLLAMTVRGSKAFSALNEKSNQQIAGFLQSVSRQDAERLVACMIEIQQILTNVNP